VLNGVCESALIVRLEDRAGVDDEAKLGASLGPAVASNEVAKVIAELTGLDQRVRGNPHIEARRCLSGAFSDVVFADPPHDAKNDNEWRKEDRNHIFATQPSGHWKKNVFLETLSPVGSRSREQVRGKSNLLIEPVRRTTV
jgi:hypothetical protein